MGTPWAIRGGARAGSPYAMAGFAAGSSRCSRVDRTQAHVVQAKGPIAGRRRWPRAAGRGAGVKPAPRPSTEPRRPSGTGPGCSELRRRCLPTSGHGGACWRLDQRVVVLRVRHRSGVGDQTQCSIVSHGGVGGQDPHGVTESTGAGGHKVTFEAVPAALVGLREGQRCGLDVTQLI